MDVVIHEREDDHAVGQDTPECVQRRAPRGFVGEEGDGGRQTRG